MTEGNWDALTSPKDVMPTNAELSIHEAVMILQRVVTTRASKITSFANLDRVSGYHYSEIAAALRRYSRYLLDINEKHEEPVFGYEDILKKLPGDRSLMLKITKNPSLETPNLNIITLKYILPENDNPQYDYGITITVPLQGKGRLPYATRFEDLRRGHKRIVVKGGQLGGVDTSQGLRNKDKILRDNQTFWTGMRWLAANMIAWQEPGIILPEELDKVQYPTTDQ